MTVANWITILRLLLIPVFVAFCIYYGQGLQAGQPLEWQRWAAIGSFMLAAISDAVDGFVARKFNQFSKLGRILDPIADKGLLFAAVITMSFSQWHYALPLWFVVLVVSRDILILGGCALLQHLTGHLEIKPTFLGKTCTASQMIVVTLFLLQSRNAPPLLYDFSVWIAGALTALSGLDYIRLGMANLHEHGHTAPERPRNHE